MKALGRAVIVGLGLLLVLIPRNGGADEKYALYQFQYTQSRLGAWTPQHAIVFRFWFGQRLSARGGP